MNESQKNWVIISLGGSLVYPKDLDTEYVSRFVELIKSKTSESNFAVITGGGHLARIYQQKLQDSGKLAASVELDMVGIDATRENAEYVRSIFGGAAEPAIFQNPMQVNLTGKSVLVGGGWKPGHSSDGSAVGLAQTLGAKKLINLSNIDYVYTADPRKDPTATPIVKSTWAEFRKILPAEWDPGANVPFDPVAAKMAEEMGLEVAVMNGQNLENLSAYLDGKEFVGTVIS